MATAPQGKSRGGRYIPHAAPVKGIAWGFIGGLAGTLVMDLVLMGALACAGLPVLSCFSMVGNTVASLFSTLGMETAGGFPMGVATHYLVGPLVGAIYGSAVARRYSFRVSTLKKSVLLAVVYVEILSQPMLAMTPILLKLSAAETLQWYGGSFVMHFIWGIVFGLILSHGLLPAGSPAPGERTSMRASR